MNAEQKQVLYQEAEKELISITEGETNVTALMATISCILAQKFDYYFWTGFYIVDPAKENELVVGPYQGTLGCLRIPFGRGVCGTAAATLKTQVVEDVHAFPGHIACDSRSNSEIVVPVLNAQGQLIAVLDVDSVEAGSFDDTDRIALETLMQRIFAQ
ncbi:L-methionine (R)-S-oxide reductase [Thalassospira sp. MBR-102]|uniref:GAF domain-containing protein n=2 Tax=Thalassospira TaxID=168934 RepID=A0AB72UCK3_9PROT|nr:MULTISPECIES: GAF domain-containing protein [Thalassospira]AJD52055.1 GAF domain-containing protein [Thalassospira xiamenensis M-5 = DSM 17429]KEO50649.1 cyclic diguanylate phosphodiesterase [Thalassospira permensis NBRC 106175]MDM7975376.1 GAF domain-containing protein [Thalassospira xiamenensis]OHZ00853.1 diguanylate phosphodiesterase [Thalassospira sp. MIT1004]SIS92405.1 GAF domain-containing protein [Thalassospira xiamenensis M-5 = DSM 17429]